MHKNPVQIHNIYVAINKKKIAQFRKKMEILSIFQVGFGSGLTEGSDPDEVCLQPDPKPLNKHLIIILVHLLKVWWPPMQAICNHKAINLQTDQGNYWNN